MKTLCSIFILAVCASAVSAQQLQITSGPGEELNPSLSRNPSHNQFEWLVFERQTPDSSFVVGKRLWYGTNTWDSVDVIIARSALPETLRYPDVCIKYNYAVAGWQQRSQGKWKIYYSFFPYSRPQWSTPVKLTDDSLDSRHVLLQPIHPDSQFVAIWKSGAALRYAKIHSGANGTRDTIAVTGSDSTNYDMTTNGYDMASVMWSENVNGGGSAAVLRDIRFGPKDSLFTIDTAKIAVSVRRPRFFQSYAQWKRIVFESPRSEQYTDVYTDYVSPPFAMPLIPYKISTTSLSAFNARAYMNPVVTAPSDGQYVDQAPYSTLIVYQVSTAPESAHLPDSSYLRVTTRLRSDSIRTAGYNRNPVLGSNGIYKVGPSIGFHIPVVWESNRSGTTHLYTQTFLVDMNNPVDPHGNTAHSFALRQNYPNPFNPVTTIRYYLPVSSPVTLAVYDVLGKKIAELVRGTQTAGEYAVEFSGAGLSSGVYFYRLTASKYSETRKLHLLK